MRNSRQQNAIDCCPTSCVESSYTPTRTSSPIPMPAFLLNRSVSGARKHTPRLLQHHHHQRLAFTTNHLRGLEAHSKHIKSINVLLRILIPAPSDMAGCILPHDSVFSVSPWDVVVSHVLCPNEDSDATAGPWPGLRPEEPPILFQSGLC